MSSYHLDFDKKAIKALNKLDPAVKKRIIDWLEFNLQDCLNPRLHGKALTGKLSGLWRYRVGDYRIIADIRDDQLIIFCLKVSHRREVYRST